MSGRVDKQILRVCHVAMGDLWAGAEVQLAALAGILVEKSEVEISTVLFNDGKLAVELRALGVPTIILPETEWNSLRILKELTLYCHANQFDLIHTHKYKDNIIGVIGAQRAGIRHVVRTVHGLSEPFRGMKAFSMRMYECIDDFANKVAVSRLIAVSSQIEQVLIEKYGTKKVAQIHNGISLKQVHKVRDPNETRKMLGIKASSCLIGTVGRLTAVKGHEQLLEAAKLLLKSGRDLHFVIVGDGPLMDELRGTARKLGLVGSLTFLGQRDDAKDLIHAMDIFVLPSLHEGIPMVILEAMALARPVVASNVGGIPEIISNRVHGLLVPADNPEALADACAMFLEDPPMAKQCGQAGQFRVQQEFSLESMGAKVTELYQALIESGRRIPI